MSARPIRSIVITTPLPIQRYRHIETFFAFWHTERNVITCRKVKLPIITSMRMVHSPHDDSVCADLQVCWLLNPPVMRVYCAERGKPAALRPRLFISLARRETTFSTSGRYVLHYSAINELDVSSGKFLSFRFPVMGFKNQFKNLTI